MLNLGSVNIGDIIMRDGSTTTFNHPIDFTHDLYNSGNDYDHGFMINEGTAQINFGSNLTKD